MIHKMLLEPDLSKDKDELSKDKGELSKDKTQVVFILSCMFF